MVKEITLIGSPYERGVLYGREAKEEIRTSIESYRRLFGARGMDWQQAREKACGFLEAIQKADVRYLEEMKGIAQGAALDFEDILAINCRSELLYAPLAPQECTAFSLVPPATKEGKVLAGQNWDYTRSQREALVILRIPAQEGKPSQLLFLEAGMIGGKGMNSAGLSLTLNALSTTEYAYGLPLHIRMRRILEQKTFEGAYQAAIEGGHPSPVHWIITHRDGRALGLEIDCSGMDELPPQGGAHFHTNHFIGPKFGARATPSPNSLARLDRISALLGEGGALTVEDVKNALADHGNHPHCICKHVNPDAARDIMHQGATNHALIMDLTAGKAYFALGNPCESEYQILKVE
ncbi:MAG: hypothetical protein IJN80_04475 [Clostridia bacterium]|nr:hypothetical protein [Clostridia bacterium]